MCSLTNDRIVLPFVLILCRQRSRAGYVSTTRISGIQEIDPLKLYNVAFNHLLTRIRIEGRCYYTRECSGRRAVISDRRHLRLYQETKHLQVILQNTPRPVRPPLVFFPARPLGPIVLTKTRRPKWQLFGGDRRSFTGRFEDAP